MSSNNDDHPGIPTRAIHEAYLDMQRALKRYRQARDSGQRAAIDDAHGDVQESVLTLFELLRPHIKHIDSVREYWEGEAPEYNGDGTPPIAEEGAAVLQVQEHIETIAWEDLDIESEDELDQLETLEAWDDKLGLNGDHRLVGVLGADNDDGLVIKLQHYQKGLRNLDNWETKHRNAQTKIGGFLGATTKQQQRRVRIDMQKLKRASRELAEVAEELGALSEFEPRGKRTEITREDIQDIQEWKDQNLP